MKKNIVILSFIMMMFFCINVGAIPTDNQILAEINDFNETLMDDVIQIKARNVLLNEQQEITEEKIYNTYQEVLGTKAKVEDTCKRSEEMVQSLFGRRETLDIQQSENITCKDKISKSKCCKICAITGTISGCLLILVSGLCIAYN